MKKIDILIFFRNIKKHKIESFVKLSSLAIGLTFILLSFLYANSEFSYDRFHKDASQIYRIESKAERRGVLMESPLTAPMIGSVALDQLPEVENMTRMFTYSWKEEALVEYQNKQYFEKGFFLVDPNFFEIFSFKLKNGTKELVFKEPNAVVLSERCAQKYFGDENPIGKQLQIKNFGETNLIVTGIIEDAPIQSHFSYDLLLPIDLGAKLYWPDFDKAWDNASFYTYIKLSAQTNTNNFLPRFNKVMHDSYTGRFALPEFKLKALTKIHLFSHLNNEIQKNGSLNKVIFAIILGMVVALICISNFINITISQLIYRIKEVGIKKLMGVNKAYLFGQFILESMMLALVSLVLAFVVIEVILTPLSNLINININPYHGNLILYLVLVFIAVFFGGLAGLFPAIMYSSYRAIDILKGKLWNPTHKWPARRLVLLFQFIIVGVLLVSSLEVNNQKNYLTKTNPGFSTQGILIVPLKDYRSKQHYDVFKNELITHPHIDKVSTSSSLPLNIKVKVQVDCEGWDETVQMNMLNVDYDFIDLYKLKLIEGRSFRPEYGQDARLSYIINKTAAKILAWDEPIGKQINYSNKGLKIAEFEQGKVIGVVDDFHHVSLHQKIEPLIIKVYEEPTYVSIRFTPSKYDEVKEFVKSAFQSTMIADNFESYLVSKAYQDLYANEIKMGTVFNYCTSIAILIGIVGLFSLSSLEIKRKYKEIGIRKVLGAKTTSIIAQFMKQYGILVLVANLISLPLSWLALNRWLSGIAYAGQILVWNFIITIIGTFLIVIIAVIGQAYLASLQNPVNTLKYE